MSRRPLAGGFRLLCETGAAIGAACGPPLPSAPSGTRAAILKKCDVCGMAWRLCFLHLSLVVFQLDLQRVELGFKPGKDGSPCRD
jgi:hypothetical protein